MFIDACILSFAVSTPSLISSTVPNSLVLFLNSRSLHNKTVLIHALIMDEQADLVGELGGSDLTQLYQAGYSLQHQTRLEVWRGGIAIVHSSSFSH